MASKTVGTLGSLSLSDLQTVVQQQEGIFGPLIAMGIQNQENFITFEIGPTPRNRTELEISPGGMPSLKPGHTLVCTGVVLVKSSPVSVTAHRKNE